MASTTLGVTRTPSLRMVMMVALTLVGLMSTALVGGCDDKTSADVAPVTIGGKKFFLEVAANTQKRFRGLSERTHIDPDGGMLFVFPRSQVVVHEFVMRDCPIAIDIIYLDGTGHITAMHEMKPEAPRDPSRGEGTPADADNTRYNARLTKYSSRYPAQFVIELAEGSLKKLSLKDGDAIQFDREGLLKIAD